MSAVGIVGLGNMGSGMAASLKRGGFDVIGTAASAKTRALAADQGIETVDTVAKVAGRADFIVLALPTPEAVISVVEGPAGLAANGKPGQLIIDTTTSDAPTSRRVAASLRERGIGFIDAPVSGAPEVARKGQLTMMLGGSAEDIARAQPILKALSALTVHVGALGAGNLAKLANNLMAAAHFLVAAEVVTMMEQAGLDARTVLNVINASSGRSFITERVYPNWIFNDRFDLGFSVKLMRKDVRLAIEEISRLGADLPVVSTVGREWSGSHELVADDEDITRIVELPGRRSGSRAA